MSEFTQVTTSREKTLLSRERMAWSHSDKSSRSAKSDYGLAVFDGRTQFSGCFSTFDRDQRIVRLLPPSTPKSNWLFRNLVAGKLNCTVQLP